MAIAKLASNPTQYDKALKHIAMLSKVKKLLGPSIGMIAKDFPHSSSYVLEYRRMYNLAEGLQMSLRKEFKING